MLPVTRVVGHKEWAPGRKSDPIYDMNWRRAGVAGVQPRVTPEGLFMALTAAQEQEILEAARSVLFGKANVRPAGEMAMAVYNLQRSLDSMALRVDELVKKPAGQVDTAPVVAAVVDAVTRAGIADKVLDGLAAALSSRPV